MSKKRLNKKERRIVTALFLAAVCVMVVKGVMQQPKILENQDRIADLQEKIEYEKQRMQEVDEMKDKVDTDEYIEKVAREKLGLIKDDEIVFIDVSGN